MVYIIIVIILCMHPCFTSISCASSKHIATKFQIIALEESLANYRRDVGRYPTTEEGLSSLTSKPNGTSSWNGPYRTYIVPDYWGSPIMYFYPPRYGNMEYDLYSFGANQIDDHGDKDDITNWRDISLRYYGGVPWTQPIVIYGVIFLLLILALYALKKVVKKRRE